MTTSPLLGRVAAVQGNACARYVRFLISVSFLITMHLAKTSSAAAAASGTAALLVLILFGEVSPKGVAVEHPVRFSHIVAPFLYAFYRLGRPVSGILRRFAAWFTGLLARRLPRLPFVTREELKMLVEMAESHGALDDGLRGMIQQVVELVNIRVNEVMVPRVDMALFDLAKSGRDFCDLVRRTHEERIPVYEGSMDNVVGFVRARDVLPRAEADIRGLVRPVRFIPETQTVESLLRDFQRTGEPLAIVVDEYGGTSGLVTMEHILEEVVGQIRHESEDRETSVRKLDEDTYLLAGDLNTHEWRQLLSIDFDPPGIETMGGFVMSLLGHVPAGGECVEWHGLRFQVEKMTGRRISLVRVQRVRPAEEQ